MSVAEWVAQIRAKLAENQPSMEGVEGTFQFVLTGDEGGTFHARLANGEAAIEEGDADSPSVTVTISAADFAELVAGRLNAAGAFMSGRLKLQGDIGLAMRLQSLLS